MVFKFPFNFIIITSSKQNYFTWQQLFVCNNNHYVNVDEMNATRHIQQNTNEIFLH